MTTDMSHEDGCLMCAVRALTEGEPAVNWTPETPGQAISGVVLRHGSFEHEMAGEVPFVDLWTGGTGRVRVKAFPAMLRDAIRRSEAKVGDTLTLRFEGSRTIESGRFAGRQFKTFSAETQRGH